MTGCNKNPAFHALVGISLLAFLFLGSFLQRTTTELFASPDETAVMLFARAWSWENGFRLPYDLPQGLDRFSGLHARSMVRQGDVLVPVGFLGMPMLVGLAESLGRGWGAYATLILVMSCAYPLWRLARGAGRRTGVMTVLLFLSFPTVLLYANRGLFPNLAALALALWAVWGAGKIASADSGPGVWIAAAWSGIALGLALLIRPVEAVWIIPWIAAAPWILSSSSRPPALRGSWRRLVLTGTAALLVCACGVFAAMKTYPFHSSLFDQPVIGYLLHDAAGAAAYAGAVDAGSSGWTSVLPFGLHPRAMWENARSYFFGFLGLWTCAALLGSFVRLRRRWGKCETVFFFLTGWTLASLLVFYGQSLYADNIRGNATLGNSFLRYMLPLAPIMAYGCALFIDALWSARARGKLLGASAALFFIFLGGTVAFAHDEESILRTRHELRRYELIRGQAERTVAEGAVILSERSDKIFASGPFMAVSPIPEDAVLDALSSSDANVYLFHRTLDGGDLECALTERFGMPPVPLFSLDNETFYRL
jgi:hypothetical protein